METKLTQPRVFLEIRNSTQSGHLVLGNFPENYSDLQITLGLSTIHLRTAEKCVNLDWPVGVRIVPPSCRSLQYITGDGLHMRLQVQIDRPAELVPTVIGTLEAQARYVFRCQTCGQSVLKKEMFQRVLPLPNGNWNDLVEHWCCHPDPFAKKLQPKLDDCLLGDTFLLVNVASIDETAVREEKADQSEVRQNADDTGTHLVQMPKENNVIVCTRCRKVLGNVTSSDTITFYVTEVLVQSLTNKALKRQICKRSLFVETVVAGRLMELSSAQSTFRFCIQGHDGKTYVLSTREVGEEYWCALHDPSSEHLSGVVTHTSFLDCLSPSITAEHELLQALPIILESHSPLYTSVRLLQRCISQVAFLKLD
uniref:E3 ubiquitin-protein ligase E3D isoform X4 n=1 Tax=Pristiophorus japonicus TaxID=55135 RepID=UPI00398E839C